MRKKRFINTDAFSEIWDQRKLHKILSGGQALFELLSKADPKLIQSALEAKLARCKTVGGALEIKQKLEMINGFVDSKVNPNWIALKVLPVLPAELRPVLILEDGRCASSDLNELYARTISANRVVAAVCEAAAEDSSICCSTVVEALRALQDSVDELMDNAGSSKLVRGFPSVPLKSLTEMLKGKKGRFRQSLLGRRVDYSGRSVIAPGPELRLNECGLPRDMAAELFKPLVYARILETGKAQTLSGAKAAIVEDPKLAETALIEVASFYPVILNRAPTLHKLSLQAFNARLIDSKVIRLHPLVCSGFNADFDGDQMAVHIPLSKEAQIEASTLMISTKNILHPAHGSSAILPTQDMVLGLYYMSFVSAKRSSVCFTSYAEIDCALATRAIDLHTRVRFCAIVGGRQKLVVSTPGRLLVSEVIPKACNIVYDVNAPALSKSRIAELVECVYEKCGSFETIEFCEALMRLGFKYASSSGISLSKADLVNIPYKERILIGTRRAVSGLGESLRCVLGNWRLAKIF